jgi:hypothetical protein
MGLFLMLVQIETAGKFDLPLSGFSANIDDTIITDHFMESDVRGVGAAAALWHLAPSSAFRAS